MDVTPLVKKGQKIIQGYSGGIFKISGQAYPGPVIVFSQEVLEWPVGRALEDLTAADFLPLINKRQNIDVMLLGCGPQMKFLPDTLKRALKAESLHVEIMDTGAACRTYNVLMAEGRQVCAALLPA